VAYSYGGLTINVTADTKGLRAQITKEAEGAGGDAAKGLGSSFGKVLGAAGGIAAGVGKAIATGLGGAAIAATGFGVSAFRAAARVGEMDASLRALAKANNLSYDSMQQTVKAVKAQGIETGVAQGLVAQFARNQLSLADATKLATVAQDAAVISGRNSTEVLDDLVHGITTQNSLVLRNAGLNVQAGKAMEDYAKSVGKSTKDLTDSERAQAVLNATLESGKTVAGAYAEAMKEPGKVLRSFPRLVDDIKISVGQGLVKALGPAILGAYDLAKAFAKAVEPGGVLGPIFDAIGVAVGKLVAPVTGLLSSWAKLIEGLKPDQISRATEAIKQFGPAAIVAGGAMAVFTGAQVLGKIPVLGGMLSSLLGPVKALGAGVLALPPPVLAVVAAIAILAVVSSNFRNALLDLGRAIISALKPAFDAIVAGVRQALPPVRDLVRAIGDGLAPILRNLIPILGPIGQILGTVITVAFKQLAQAAAALAPILAVVFAVLNFLVKVIVTVLAPILRLVAGLVSVAGAASTVVSPLQVIVSVCSAVASAIATVVRWIFGGSPGLIPAFIALAGVIGPVSGAMSALAGVFRAVASAIAAAWSAVTSATSAAMSRITSVVASGGKAVQSAVTSAFNAVRSVVSSAMSAVTSAVSSGFNSARSAAASAASGMLSAISSAMSGIRSAVSSTFSQITGMVSSGLASAVGAARSGGAAIMNGLQSGIQSAAGAVMSTIAGIAGKVAGALSSALKIGSPSRLTIPMGVDVIRGLEVGMEREAGHLALPALHAPAVSGGGLVGGVPALAGAGGQITVNVYPQPSQDPREVAAMVSRELSWAMAGGL
jgi:phage-related protein